MHLKANSDSYGEIDVEIIPSQDRRIGIDRRSPSAFDRLFKFQFTDRRKDFNRRGPLRISIERIPGFGIRIRIYDYSIATVEQLKRFLNGIRAEGLPLPIKFGRNFIRTTYDQADQRI